MDHDQFDQNERSTIFSTPVMSARKVVSYEAIGDTFDQSDKGTCGHGTHVSGILAGSSKSGKMRNIGLAKDAKIAFMDIGSQSSACAGISGCKVNLQAPTAMRSLFNRQRQGNYNVVFLVYF